ncbi:hypothetical protein RF158_05565, partial [Escherichia coli]|uniref:hypothetical protein n=1 Tax=Escherichia coli TaxID=562 RepID=UPI0028140099
TTITKTPSRTAFVPAARWWMRSRKWPMHEWLLVVEDHQCSGTTGAAIRKCGHERVVVLA